MFCYQCGNDLASSSAPSAAPTAYSGHTESDLWRDFIGPNAEQYLEQFKKFGTAQAPRFALTWNWPAFLYVSFLWFLYRKMYLYAAVYAIGPMVSTYLTGDMTSGMVWTAQPPTMCITGIVASTLRPSNNRPGMILRNSMPQSRKREASSPT